jgi:hypothetical protein
MGFFVVINVGTRKKEKVSNDAFTTPHLENAETVTSADMSMRSTPDKNRITQQKTTTKSRRILFQVINGFIPMELTTSQK